MQSQQQPWDCILPHLTVSPAAAARSQPQSLLPFASPYLLVWQDPLFVLPSAPEPAGPGGMGKWSQCSCWNCAGRGAGRGEQSRQHGLELMGECNIPATCTRSMHKGEEAPDCLCGIPGIHTAAQTPIFCGFLSSTHLNLPPSPSWGSQVPPLAQGLEEQPLSATSQSLPWTNQEKWE